LDIHRRAVTADTRTHDAAVLDDEVLHRGAGPDRGLTAAHQDLEHLADERGAVGHQVAAPKLGGVRTQEHTHRDGECSRRAVEVLHRAQLVGLDDESVVLGHRRLDPIAPVTEFGGVERDSLDGPTGCVAALVIRVVVAPAGAPHQPDALADKKVDHLDARGEEHLAAGG
jgi:hypothetical protein